MRLPLSFVLLSLKKKKCPAGVAGGGDRPGLEHAPLRLPRRIRSIRRAPLPGLPVGARMVRVPSVHPSVHPSIHPSIFHPIAARRAMRADSGRPSMNIHGTCMPVQQCFGNAWSFVPLAPTPLVTENQPSSLLAER